MENHKHKEEIFKLTAEEHEKLRPAMERVFAKKPTIEQIYLSYRMYEADEKINSFLKPILDIYRSLFIHIIKLNKQQYMKYRKINNHKKNKQKWNQNL
jgi:hypothetical protein